MIQGSLILYNLIDWTNSESEGMKEVYNILNQVEKTELKIDQLCSETIFSDKRVLF